MPLRPDRLLSIFLSFCLLFEQSLFAQSIDLSRYFVRNFGQNIPQSDKFRPLHLRYLGYDNLSQDFKILLDKGDAKKEDLENKAYIEENTQTLLKYFFIGLSLPNEKFWVNLRPDSPDNILDPDLEKTDIGRIFLEADLQLKKDTASFTSPQNPQGKAYWDKLYKKAGELFPAAGGSAFGGGSENITIPTITRPWIVPGEVIIREAPDNAYIYKATLKVMLEEDYLDQKTEKPKNIKTEAYNFQDPRLKELNEYSTQLIKETIIPKLTYEVNTSKRYAPLRQVYYSLILAQWFKQKYGSFGSIRAPGTSAPVNNYISMIDSGNLTNLTSSQSYDKQAYFQQYQKSFKDGEYNLQEPVYTPMGQSIRRYTSGGIGQFNNIMGSASPVIVKKGVIPKVFYKYCIGVVFAGILSFLSQSGAEELKIRIIKAGDELYAPLKESEQPDGENNSNNPKIRISNKEEMPSEEKKVEKKQALNGETLRTLEESTQETLRRWKRGGLIVDSANFSTLEELPGGDNLWFDMYKNSKWDFGSAEEAVSLIRDIKERYKNASVSERAELNIQKLHIVASMKRKFDFLFLGDGKEHMIDLVYELFNDTAMMEGMDEPSNIIDKRMSYSSMLQGWFDSMTFFDKDLVSYSLGKIKDGEPDKRYLHILTYSAKQSFPLMSEEERRRSYKVISSLAKEKEYVPFLYSAVALGMFGLDASSSHPIFREHVDEFISGLASEDPQLRSANSLWEKNNEGMKRILREYFNNDLGNFLFILLRNRLPGEPVSDMFKLFIISNRNEITGKIIPSLIQNVEKGDFDNGASLKVIGELCAILNFFPYADYLPRDTLERVKELVLSLNTPYAYSIFMKILQGDYIGWKEEFDGKKVLSRYGIASGDLKNIFSNLIAFFQDRDRDGLFNNSSLCIDLFSLIGTVADELVLRGENSSKYVFFSYLHYLALQIPGSSNEMVNYFTIQKVKDCFFEMPEYFKNNEEIISLSPYEQFTFYLALNNNLRSVKGWLSPDVIQKTGELILRLRKDYSDETILAENTSLLIMVQSNDKFVIPDLIKDAAIRRGVKEENIMIIGDKGESLEEIYSNIEKWKKNAVAADLIPTCYVYGHGNAKDRSIMLGGAQKLYAYDDFRSIVKGFPKNARMIFDSCHSQLIVNALSDIDSDGKIIIATAKDGNIAFASGNDKYSKENAVGSLFAWMIYNQNDLVQPLRIKDLWKIGPKMLKLMHKKNENGRQYYRPGGSMPTINLPGNGNKGFKEVGALYSFDPYNLLVAKSDNSLYSVSLAVEERKTSSLVADSKGGIAFNALPIQTESVASSVLGALPGVQAFKGDLDAEWVQIQAVFNAGIRPSAQRLADFAAAGAASPLASQRRDDVLGLVSELLRRDEEDKMLAPIDPALKDLLNALESLL